MTSDRVRSDRAVGAFGRMAIDGPAEGLIVGAAAESVCGAVSSTVGSDEIQDSLQITGLVRRDRSKSATLTSQSQYLQATFSLESFLPFKLFNLNKLEKLEKKQLYGSRHF